VGYPVVCGRPWLSLSERRLTILQMTTCIHCSSSPCDDQTPRPAQVVFPYAQRGAHCLSASPIVAMLHAPSCVLSPTCLYP
jgi:hypothetical protein